MIKYKEPVVLGLVDIFKWWLHNLKKDKPYLKTPNFCYLRKKNILGKKRDVHIISINKKELIHLKQKVLTIETEVAELEQSESLKWWFTETTHKIFALKKEVSHIEDRIKILEKSNPEGEKELMSYKLFVKIIELYNQKVIKALVEDGASIKLWNNLGYIYVLNQKKTDLFSNANIDWKASKEFKQELIARGDTPKDKEHPNGKNWFQFYEDTQYLRVAWTKKYGICKVPNNVVYAFYPTKSVRGIINHLTNKNKEDIFLKEKYIKVNKKSA